MNMYIRLVCKALDPELNVDRSHWVWDLFRQDLADRGFETFEETEDSFSAYALRQSVSLPEDIVEDQFELEVFSNLFRCSIETLSSENWNELWERESFEPIMIGDELFVRASYHDSGNGNYRKEVIIDPKMTFGSGTHHTTAMMLRQIIQRVHHGDRVADIGCGTGILGIVALIYGATDCSMVDIDPRCVENTIYNLQQNGFETSDHIRCYCSDISILSSQGEEGKLDCLFANIHRNIILNDMPLYQTLIRKGGLLFLSGILKEDLESIEEALNNYGFGILTTDQSSEWVAVVAEKGA